MSGRLGGMDSMAEVNFTTFIYSETPGDIYGF